MTLNTKQRAEIATAQKQTFLTKRATVPALEEILYTAIPVLDHGFIRVIDYMGDDSSIVQAARVSYGKGTKQTSQDKGLINYLMRHRHTTPFEMCEIKYHIKLPIFVARQWIRHRTASVNEYSARYSILDKEFYLPAPQHLAAQSSTNRQGRERLITGQQAEEILSLLKEDSLRAYDHYEQLLNEREDGTIIDLNRDPLARELARMNLSLNFYTQWYWKINLHNLFHFAALRADHHAQYEIRAYSYVLLETLSKWVPFAYEAFMEYRMHGAQLSRTALELLRKRLNGGKITKEDSGLSTREWDEFTELFGLTDESNL